MERSRELLEAADLILYVLDGAEGITPEDRDFLQDHCAGNFVANCTAAPSGVIPPVMLLWNKADLTAPPLSNQPAVMLSEITPLPRPVSAKTGSGIAELTREIAGVLEKKTGGGEGKAGAGIGTARQKELIDRAVAALEEALALADKAEPLDLIAPLLREGVNALGEITGEVSTAEILNAMFSRFCVGK
jgi:tRNA modification GTPase